MNARKRVLLAALITVLLCALPAAASELVNMEFKQAPLVDVFQILGQLGGYNVLVDPSVQGEVTFALKDLTVEEALDLVTRTTGFRYKLLGNTLVIGSEQRLKTEFGTETFSFIPVQHVAVEAAERLVSLVVPNVKTYIDREQRLLVLSGLTADLDVAKNILRQYDQPGFAQYTEEEEGEQLQIRHEPLVSQAVPVYYGDGSAILAKVRQNWPQREFNWDKQTENIIGEATKDEWREIRLFVEEEDVPHVILRGLLGSGKEVLALVEYKGSTILVKQGDMLADWQLITIGDGLIELAKGSRKLVVRMGR